MLRASFSVCPPSPPAAFRGDILVHDVDGDGFGAVAILKSEFVDDNILHRMNTTFKLWINIHTKHVESIRFLIHYDLHPIDRHIGPTLILQFRSGILLGSQPTSRDEIIAFLRQMENAVIENQIMRRI